MRVPESYDNQRAARVSEKQGAIWRLIVEDKSGDSELDWAEAAAKVVGTILTGKRTEAL
jgi:hypothetical protein